MALPKLLDRRAKEIDMKTKATPFAARFSTRSQSLSEQTQMVLKKTTEIVITDSIAQCRECRVEFTWTWVKAPRFCPMCGRKNAGELRRRR